MNIQDYEIFKPNFYVPFENNGKTFQLNYKPYLDIVLTDYCNANCSFCIGDLVHKKTRLTFEALEEKVLFAVNNMGVKEVLLLGGEPTISPMLIKVIKFLSTLKLDKIIMTSNGLRLGQHDRRFLWNVLSAGLTNLNISFMSNDPHKQKEITKAKEFFTTNELLYIATEAQHNGIKVRVNNNIFKGNNDNIKSVIDFYNSVRFCDSVKFSPLLKTDSFSVIDFKSKWVKENILSDEDYDKLFEKIENTFKNRGYSVITNEEQFGFVKNSMIPLSTPIILNWNQHGQMMNKVVKESKINNLKILPNGELSLSWNRECPEYFIKTN